LKEIQKNDHLGGELISLDIQYKRVVAMAKEVALQSCMLFSVNTRGKSFD